MSQSSSRSLPQSRSGCAGLAGVNISLKNTTAYFSQVRLQTRLVLQTCRGLGVTADLHAAAYCGSGDLGASITKNWCGAELPS